MSTTKSKPPRPAAALATTKKTKTLLQTAKRISEAGRKRAEELLHEIERRKQRIAEDFYDIGKALRELQTKKLYGALGYASFEEMLSARNVMSLSQAHRLIRIVTALPREKALAVGSVKAALLVGYSEATPEPDTPEWLLEKGTLPSGKRVSDASTRDIEEATKKIRGAKARKAAGPEETEARAGARRAQAALRKRGAKGAVAEAVKKEGKWWVRVEVPAKAVDLFEE